MAKTWIGIGFGVVGVIALAVVLNSERSEGHRRDQELGVEVESPRDGTPVHDEASSPIATVPFTEESAATENSPEGATAQVGSPWAVSGQVVDADRRPVADAAILVRLKQGRLCRGRSGEDGRFLISVGRSEERPEGHAVVEANGQRALRVLGWPARVEETTAGGKIVRLEYVELGVATKLEVLAQRAGQPLSQARVSLRLGRTEIAERLTDAEGRASWPALSQGEYFIFACAAGGLHAHLKHRLPDDGEGPVTLKLIEPPSVVVKVVSDRTGDPIAGARVSTHWNGVEQDIAATDAEGCTRLSYITTSQGAIAVGAVAPGFREKIGGALVFPGMEEVELRLKDAEPFVWQLAEGDVPPPVEGAVIRLEPLLEVTKEAIPETAEVVGSTIRITGCGARGLNCLAVTEEGHLAHLSVNNGKATAKQVAFSRPRRLTVRVEDDAGQPLSGWRVSLGAVEGFWGLGLKAKTDQDGRAVFGRLPPITVQASSRLFMTGAIDLSAGDAEVALVVPRQRSLVLAFRVDGVPRIPRGYTVRTREGALARVREAPEAGEVHYTFHGRHPKQAAALTVTAEGFGKQTLEVPPSVDAAPVRLTCEMRSGATWIVEVVPPGGDRYRLHLHRWDESAAAWQHVRRIEPNFRLVATMAGLPPGRYRLEESSSGFSGAATDLGPGTTRSTLDLSQVGRVAGSVSVPSGEDPGRASVAVFSGGEEVQHRPVDEGGRFSLQVPGGDAVVLRVRHPILVPAAQGGELAVDGPRDDLVLVLRRGNEAFLRVPAERTKSWTYKVALTGPAGTRRCFGVHVGERLRFGGFAPGRHTLLIDRAPLAPLLRRDVELGAGVNDLGPWTPDAGSSIRVHLETRPGRAAPRVLVEARHLAPAFVRRAGSRGESTVELSGLIPGRFRVTVSLGELGTVLLDEEVLVSASGAEITCRCP